MRASPHGRLLGQLLPEGIGGSSTRFEVVALGLAQPCKVIHRPGNTTLMPQLFKGHPEIEVISHDRGQEYTTTATQEAPQAFVERAA